MSTDCQSLNYAKQCFEHAQLGDARRVKALIAIFVGLLKNPAGRITQVFKTSAERERAYRFLENTAVKAQAMLLALCQAGARQLEKLQFAYVVIDGSSLTLADPRGKKNFGQVGTHTQGARVMAPV